MKHEGIVNFPSPISDGEAGVTLRLGKFGEALHSHLLPRFAHLCYRQKHFHHVTGSITIGAGHVSPCTANTGTPIYACWNPPNSGVHVYVLKYCVVTVSGTPGGPLLWNYFLNQTITAAANLTPVCGFLGAGGNRHQCFTNTAFTGCTQGILLRHAWRYSAVAAAYSEGPPFETADADILLPPGAAIALMAFAAGTSHAVQVSVSVTELPISG